MIMSFLTKFFSRNESKPLPSMEELFNERGLNPKMEEISPFLEIFQHLGAEDRVKWADAVLEIKNKGCSFPKEWSEAQFELIPEIVPTWKAQRDGYYYHPIIEGLSERIRVKDTLVPEAWAVIWDINLEEITERALDHLREKSKEGKRFERHSSGIYISCFNDGLDAARILLPELWSNIFPGQNTFVAVPTENRFLVAPQVLLPKLVENIYQALAEATAPRVQATILQYVNQKLLPANLQDPHPIAQPQRELRQGDLMEAYYAQEQVLDRNLGLAAPMTMLKTNQGRSVSMAMWTEGQPVLLPECDTIGFLDKRGRPLGIFFRQTLPRISELKGEVLEIWGPRRMRFEGFPTIEQLDRLEIFASPEQMVKILGGTKKTAPPKSSVSSAQPPIVGGNSPVPAHLRGLSLGNQNEEEE